MQRQNLRFSGLFNGSGVYVIDKTEAADLYAFGTYGKGVLSRSRPLFLQGATTGMFHSKEKKKLDQKQNPSHLVSSSTALIGDERVLPTQEVAEYLQLSLEEAFFLAYGLGCLTITLSNGIEANLTECWTAFNLAEPRFCELYCAYHYYRASGWVPKSGTKYGVDYVLYCSGGPASFHAQYAVIVVKHSQEENATDKNLSWGQLNNVHRVSETVAKGLVICHVFHPPAFDAKDPNSLLLLPQHSITEVVVQRFTH